MENPVFPAGVLVVIAALSVTVRVKLPELLPTTVWPNLIGEVPSVISLPLPAKTMLPRENSV